MSIKSIDWNKYIQDKTKQNKNYLCKLSIRLVKIFRNKVEITTLITEWSCQSWVLYRSSEGDTNKSDSSSVSELRILGLKNWAVPFRPTRSWGFEKNNSRISKERTSLLEAPGSMKTYLSWEVLLSQLCIKTLKKTWHLAPGDLSSDQLTKRLLVNYFW